jgi:hypothetical protein
MNANSDINRMVESFEHLDLEEKEYLVDIFAKEVREQKREQIFERYLEAKANREAGKVKVGDVRDLMADLEKD